MDTEIVAITSMIVLGVILTIACSYLCTQCYSLILKLGSNGRGRQERRRPSSTTRPCLQSFRERTSADPIPAVVTVSRSPAPTETAPCIVTRNSTTTTTILRSNIADTVDVAAGPPPLPPRPRTHLPWTTTTSARHSELVTLRNPRRTEDDNFQFPPQSVVSTLPGRDSRDILHLLRAFPLAGDESRIHVPRNRQSMAGFQIDRHGLNQHEPAFLQQQRYYRQSAPLSDFSILPGSNGWTRIMASNHHPHPLISEELPPSYEDAMRQKQMEETSSL